MSTPEPSAEPIRSTLARLRAVASARVASEALAQSALVATCVAGAGAALLAFGPATEPVRIGVIAVIAVSAIVPLVLGALRARRAVRDEALARRIEEALPAFRTDVRAALELGAMPAPASEATAALRRSLVARVGAGLAAQGDALNAALPPARTGAPLLALVGVIGVIAASAWVAPRGYGAGWVHLLRGVPERTDDSTPVHREPLVSTVDITVRPPAYTGLSPRFVPRSTGDVEVLAGSEVSLGALALQPVQSARLVLELEGGATPVALEVVGGRALSARFVATASSAYRIELVREDGERAVDPVPRRITVVPDAAPAIELLHPGASLEVTPEQVIDVEYLAGDDFGLTELSLVWAFAGDEERTHVVPLQGPVGRSFQEHVPFDLAPLSLQPREEVVLWIEGLDNNAVGGPSVGRSRAVSLRVAAPDDRHDEVLALRQALFESLLSRLGDMLPSGLLAWSFDEPRGRVEARLAPRSPLEAADDVRVLVDQHDAWPPVLDTWTELLRAMDADELVEQRDLDLLTESYRNVYDAERALARSLDRAAVGIDARAVPTEALASVATDLSALIDHSERAVLLLEDTIAEHIAGDVQRNLEELGDIRDRLRDLMQQYVDTQDPAVREQIERELRRLEARMQELLSRLAQQMQNLPAEHLNLEGLEPSELGESLEQMGSSMERIRELLDEGDVEGAMAMLEEMAAGLDAMSAALDGPLDAAQPDGLSEFDQQLAELMDQVNELELQQQDIEQATAELEQQMHAERQAEIAEVLERQLDALHEQMGALRRELEQSPRSRLGGETQRMLTESEDAMRRAEERLAQGDVAGAREALEQAQQAASDTSWQLRRDESLMLRDPDGMQQAQGARQVADEARDGMAAIDRELQALQQLAQPRPGAAQQAQLDQLGSQQQGAQERLGQLQQQMGEFGERFPIGEGMDGPLQQAQQGMGQSSQSLQGGQPRPAMQGQQQALEGLREMRRNLQQMAQQQRRSAQSGRPQSQERVEIPGEGEGGRAGFREQVMDASREGTLENYRDAVRRYYESLLQ